jgi:mono/diheme cytochrome c family protein
MLSDSALHDSEAGEEAVRSVKPLVLVAALALAGGVILAVAPAEETPAEQQPTIQVRAMTLEEMHRLPKATGEELYTLFCAACHGLDGTGDPVARRALNTPLPDITQLRAKGEQGEYPRLHVAYVLRHPVSEGHLTDEQLATMPNWGQVLTRAGCDRVLETSIVQRLVDHVEALQK